VESCPLISSNRLERPGDASFWDISLLPLFILHFPGGSSSTALGLLISTSAHKILICTSLYSTMAPQGRYSRSHLCLTFSIITVAVTFVGLAIFREELLSNVKALRPSGPTVQCSCPAAAPQSHHHNEQTPEEHKHQSLSPTTFADLTILEELGPANVLWVNKTGTTGSEPEGWGISMFHALHCVKMWKESLNPATMMSSHVHSESEYAEHASHCINYLLQVSIHAFDHLAHPAFRRKEPFK
jgi:hypothetical protein